jgi:hypothetical protein
MRGSDLNGREDGVVAVHDVLHFVPLTLEARRVSLLPIATEV